MNLVKTGKQWKRLNVLQENGIYNENTRISQFVFFLFKGKTITPLSMFCFNNIPI